MTGKLSNKALELTKTQKELLARIVGGERVTFETHGLRDGRYRYDFFDAFGRGCHAAVKKLFESGLVRMEGGPHEGVVLSTLAGRNYNLS